MLLKTQTSNQNMQTICTINPDFLYQMMVWLHLLKPDLQPHWKNYNKPNMDKTWATRKSEILDCLGRVQVHAEDQGKISHLTK